MPGSAVVFAPFLFFFLFHIIMTSSYKASIIIPILQMKNWGQERPKSYLRFQTHFLSFALPQRERIGQHLSTFPTHHSPHGGPGRLLVQYYHQGVHTVMYNSAERRQRGNLKTWSQEDKHWPSIKAFPVAQFEHHFFVATVFVCL